MNLEMRMSFEAALGRARLAKTKRGIIAEMRGWFEEETRDKRIKNTPEVRKLVLEEYERSGLIPSAAHRGGVSIHVARKILHDAGIDTAIQHLWDGS